MRDQAIGNIVSNATREEKHLLLDRGYLGAQAVQIPRADIDAVQQDPSLANIIASVHQTR
jgi:hypothetical protein